MKKIAVIVPVILALVIALTGCAPAGGGGPVVDPTWKQMGTDFSASASAATRICFDGSIPYVASAELDGTHVYNWDTTAWVDSASGPVVYGGYPSLLFANGKLTLSTRDYRTGAYKATVETYDSVGGTWSDYPSSGGTEFSANEIAANALYSNGTTLYLGYAAKMSSADWRAAVMTCPSGGSWGALGATANFSTAIVSTTELDMAGSGGTLYFVYLVSQIPTVCKYQSGWTFLGTGGAVQTSWVTSPSIGINSAGTPYVAYFDGSTGCARVRKYDSGTSSWVDVGSSTNVSDDAAVTNNNFSVRLCMDGTTPYVAYQDDATKTIFVKKYDGTHWVIVGGEGIACAEGISHISLVVKAGVHYLAFIRKAATPVMNAWKCD